ncbi:MAG: DUF3352 domain-containing protein [Pleurocapsa sp. MO_226.B13]|nr:DUF3352 domain-containing protein [Pleurocapsa sp. MO_226.B13]
MSSKKSGFGCLPMLGIAVTLFFGGRYLSRQVLGKELTPLDAAKVIPDRALFATFVETDSQKWSQVKALGNDRSQEILESQIEKIEAELASELPNFNYQKDIQPWLDGAMFALVTEDTTRYYNGDVLVVLGIKNKLKANSFVQKLQQESQAELTESKYKGIKITETNSEGNDVTVSALIGSRLLLAEERETIEQAIDAYKENSSLASDAQTKKVFEQPLNKGTNLAQIYFPNYGELISSAISSLGNSNLSSELLSMHTSVESVVMGVGVESQGVRLQSLTNFGDDELSQYVVPSKSKLLKRFPDRTVASIEGSGIAQFWEQFLVYLKQNRDTSRYLNLASLALRESTDLNLESDIFNWMDGEFVFGVITTPTSLHPELELNFSTGLIIETSQPEKAKKTLTKLENSLQRNLAIAPTQNKINKKAVTQWRAPGVDGALNYGWLDKNNLLFTWDDFTFDSISKSRKKSLVKNKTYKAITKKVPNKNLGYVYLDVSQIMATVNQLPIPQSDSDAEAAMAFLNSLDAIASNITMPDKYTVQQDVFVMFK